MDLPILNAAIKSCRKCPSTKRNPVPGIGEVRSDLFFIGLAPGRLGADRTGIPFTQDASGNLLRLMLKETDLDSCYITNLVKCNSVDNKGRNRTPNKSEIHSCAPFLTDELDAIKPLVIVPLGEKATKLFLGNDINFGELIVKEIRRDGKNFFPLYHPGYVVRGAYDRVKYLQDFEQLAVNYMSLRR